MKKSFRRYLIIPALALLIAAISIPASIAYFTDYERASGQADITLSWDTQLDETVEDNNKHLTVANTGETPVIVRAAVFAGDFAHVTDEAGKWHNEGSWWYYDAILQPGETTSELFVEVSTADMPGYDISIICLHESSRVVYEDNDTLQAPGGWDYVPAVQGGGK